MFFRIFAGTVILLLVSQVFSQEEPTSSFYDQNELDMAFLMAVYEQDTTRVTTLLNLGANVNARDYSGITALMYSIFMENETLAWYLVSKGADVKAVDYSGLSVLHYIALAGMKELLESVLPVIEDVDIKERAGQTALIMAAENENIPLMELLVNAGALPDQTTNKGTTALMHAAAFGNFFAVDFLILNNASLDHQSIDGSTALHLAAWYGHNEIIGLLFSQGADIEQADNKGNTPLLAAVFAGNLATAWYLMEIGANPEVINSTGFTALGIAASVEDREMTDLFLQYEFREPAIQNKGNSAIAYAFYNRNTKLRKQLRPVVTPYGLYFSEGSISQGIAFNGDNAFYESSLGLFESRLQLWMKLHYHYRIGHTRILTPVSPGVFYQFHEKRQLVSASFSREFQLFHSRNDYSAGIMPALELGYTWGNYRGSSATPPGGGVVIPSAGIYFHLKQVTLSFDYRYWNIGHADISSNSYRIGIAYRIPFYKLSKPSYSPILR